MKLIGGVLIGTLILFCLGSALITVAAVYYDTYTTTEAFTAIIHGLIKYVVAFVILYILDNASKSKEFTKEINSIRNVAMVFIYIICIWLLVLVVGFWAHF